MKENKDLRNFKIVKIVELVFFFVMEACFVTFMITNKALRYSIFTNTSLFALTIMLWIIMAAIFGFLVYDLYQIRGLKITTYNLGKLAYLDKTGIPNRTSCDLMFRTYDTGKFVPRLGCGICEISNLKAINATDSKVFGDAVIRDFTKLFEMVGDKYGFVGRNGGNEFLTVIENCDHEKMAHFYEDLELAIEDYNLSSKGTNIEISYAFVLNDEEKCNSFSDLVGKAYSKLKN